MIYGIGGTQTQRSIDLLKIMTGTQIMLLSYKGMQQAITDVIAEQVHIVCENAASILPHFCAGRLHALGFTMLRRSTSAPDSPTIAESGLPGFEMAKSNSYLLPAGTPRGVVLRLNAEINKAHTAPAVSEKLLANGAVIRSGAAEQFAECLRHEAEKWRKVIKAAGIKPR